MAEAFLKLYGHDNFDAESTGLEPGILNPVVVKVMEEEGIDISNNKTKDVFDFFKQGKRYNYVITVCDEAAAERCPIFPGVNKNIHWSFSDPSAIQGSLEKKLIGTRIIRDQIKEKIKSWVKNPEEELTKKGEL
jgi:arsenate reductase